MKLHDLKNTRVTVLGAARSGVAVARLLQNAGAHVLVSDQRPADQLGEAAAQLSGLGIALESGGHTDRVFDARLLVISPGVPTEAPAVQEALRRGLRVVSELETASWFCRSPIVAVTGSNGKTTTTTLVGRVLGDARRKHVVAGNIGTAFSSVVRDMDEQQVAVLEVSSFQLDHSETFHPAISVILNITEDHMDRYQHSMERYAASKAKIFMNQTDNDTLVYCVDDPWTVKVAAQARCTTVPFSAHHRQEQGVWIENGMITARFRGHRTEVLRTGDLSLPGLHNAYNAMAATAVGMLLGVGTATLRATLRNFKGVEHRLELVKEVNGVQYYNDSKATNVDSVRYALQAFTAPIVLLLGGRDKGNDYSVLRELVQKRVKAIVAIGESAHKVEESFRTVVPVSRATSMDEAVTMAFRLASRGEIVLLSPACASFDWFTNYEHRGRVFKELVRNLS
jgi:UDP-N-acetylmuramoylalanine--D-glutamate ligase